MASNSKLPTNYKPVGRAEIPGECRIDVVEINELNGPSDPAAAEALYYASRGGLKARMLRIQQRDGSLKVEPGALYYMRGDLEMKTSTNGGVLNGVARKVLAGETLFQNSIDGSGEIWLEPTFGHLIIREVTETEPLIVDRGIFYAGTKQLKVSPALQKNVSSAAFGGEGLFQTKISGAGLAVLVSPVPEAELVEVQLNDESLSVDGNFAIARTASLQFKAKKSSKSWIGTAVSGEGLLQTFSGKGRVWLAPTAPIYSKIGSGQGIKEMSDSKGRSNNKTSAESVSAI